LLGRRQLFLGFYKVRCKLSAALRVTVMSYGEAIICSLGVLQTGSILKYMETKFNAESCPLLLVRS